MFVMVFSGPLPFFASQIVKTLQSGSCAGDDADTGVPRQATVAA